MCFFQVSNVNISYPNHKDAIHAVKNVSISCNKGEIVGIVGESGCGKSSLAKFSAGISKYGTGQIRLNDEQITFDASSNRSLYERRQIQYVFQDPLGCLDPRMKIFQQVQEPLIVHKIGNKQEQLNAVSELLMSMNIDEKLWSRKPIMLSGGQRQRVVLARSLILSPKVIICDESLSALDVTTQSQIIKLLKKITKQYQISILFISHNLSVVEYISDKVAVMYHGEIIEFGSADQIMHAPTHPYTKSLIKSLPKMTVK